MPNEVTLVFDEFVQKNAGTYLNFSKCLIATAAKKVFPKYQHLMGGETGFSILKDNIVYLYFSEEFKASDYYVDLESVIAFEPFETKFTLKEVMLPRIIEVIFNEETTANAGEYTDSKNCFLATAAKQYFPDYDVVASVKDFYIMKNNSPVALYYTEENFHPLSYYEIDSKTVKPFTPFSLIFKKYSNEK